jgi:hypothetical protein
VYAARFSYSPATHGDSYIPSSEESLDLLDNLDSFGDTTAETVLRSFLGTAKNGSELKILGMKSLVIPLFPLKKLKLKNLKLHRAD